MGKKIKLAIVGRPNVGKSALFNAICKKRIAIVDEAEGITRDRLYAPADFFGKPFEVIDTGGINPQSRVSFQEEIRRQTEIAIQEADTLVMVVDLTAGVTTLDEYVARLLLRTGKPVVLAVNKVDDFAQNDQIYPFYSLGISKVIAVSAVHHFRIAELLEAALADCTLSVEEAALDPSIHVAIIGRPNVGKSTLVNYLLDEERCLVSPIAGTTRDSVDVSVQVDGVRFTLIDTAGIRRKKAEKEVVDKFAAVRTQRAIDRADVCILMLDAVQGISVQEKRIAHAIEQQGKGCIVLFNKWDLVKGFRMEHCKKSFETDTPFLLHCPLLFASGKSGRNLDQLFPLIQKVHAEQNRRITTGQLNKFLEKVVQQYHPPMIEGKRLRIYYMAQVDVSPPCFVLFVNKAELMVDSYKKYLLNQFRQAYQFTGAPIVFILKSRKQREENAREKSTEVEDSQEETEQEESEDLHTEEELDASYWG